MKKKKTNIQACYFLVNFCFFLFLRGTATVEFSLYSHDWRNFSKGKLSRNSGSLLNRFYLGIK